jgi:hypothetical protein
VLIHPGQVALRPRGTSRPRPWFPEGGGTEQTRPIEPDKRDEQRNHGQLQDGDQRDRWEAHVSFSTTRIDHVGGPSAGRRLTPKTSAAVGSSSASDR